MYLIKKAAEQELPVSPFMKIEMYRKEGSLMVVLGVGDWYSLSQERIAQLEIGQDLDITESPLSRMARVLGMSEETLLRCLGLSPRNYLQQVFGFSEEQADSVVDATWELRHQSYLASEKGKKAA